MSSFLQSEAAVNLHKSLIASATLIALAASCSDNPQDPGGSKNPAPDVTTGQIKVTVTTAGGDRDDMYWLAAGSSRTQLFHDGAFTVTLPPGPATVELSDVAGNCSVDGGPTLTVQVVRATTVNVSFHVVCYATGFQISIHTTGSGLPSGFTLQMMGSEAQNVPVDYSAVVSRLTPGVYTFRLETIDRCTVAKGNEVTVELPARTLVPVAFNVFCVEPVRLEKIAYTLDSTLGSAPASYLALASPDGSQQTVVTTGASPSWSRDGRTIAYSDNICFDYYYESYFCERWIRTLDPETQSVRYIFAGSMPAWSPGGDVIAFVWENGLLALAPASGGTSVRVTTPSGLEAADPAWSPDGQVIAFACHPHGEVSRMCIVNRNGTGFRQLTDATSDPVLHPSWSRDGSTIAFTSISASGTSIATMPAGGGAITTLTDGFDPAWSRDGTKLIFARSDGLFTMNRDGTNVQRLTTGRHRSPAWRP
jgi:hypothetical protein